MLSTARKIKLEGEEAARNSVTTNVPIEVYAMSPQHSRGCDEMGPNRRSKAAYIKKKPISPTRIP